MTYSSLHAARAWIRPVGAAFTDALRPDGTPPLNVARAQTQHAGYVAALREAGVEILPLPLSDTLPDACFIEDCAVLLRRTLVLTRSGAPSRRAEIEGLEAFVPKNLRVHTMAAPATLDGGDVLRIHDTLLVGQSARTNSEGIEVLRSLAAAEGLRVRSVKVHDELHFKSACSLAKHDVVLLRPGIEADTFQGLGVRIERVTEKNGANVLCLGPVTLVSAEAPQTAERLTQLGMSIRVLDVSEMHRADGALTCLSVRFPHPESWAT